MSFRSAAKQALKSKFKQHRVGAVIVKGGRILSTGYNIIRPSRLLKTPTLHAEAAAILKLLKHGNLHNLCGADLFVTRFTRAGRVGLAKPCDSCTSLIRSVGIRNIHYTTNYGTTVTEKVN